MGDVVNFDKSERKEVDEEDKDMTIKRSITIKDYFAFTPIVVLWFFIVIATIAMFQ